MEDMISRKAAIDAVYKCDDIFVGDMPVMVVKADAYEALAQLPSAQLETHDKRTETHACDLISRQAVIEINRSYHGQMPNEVNHRIWKEINELPSAQPERLTDDDFETIRIHLNAYKEKLCNQHRWEEADEYQRIIDRFMAFASAQLEIIRCKACRWRNDPTHWLGCPILNSDDNNFCSYAERRTDG